MPVSGSAQVARDSLRRGIQAYDFAEYGAARSLLAAALNPAAGPRDSLWVAGLHRFAHILIDDGKDSLAAVWLRWALRQKPDAAVDTVNFPPAVVTAFALARGSVSADSPGDSVTETIWDWSPPTPTPVRFASEAPPGGIRIERGGAPVSVFVEGVGPLAIGERQALAPGSYTILVSAPGVFRTRVTREVLPGVTTALRFRQRRPAPQPTGFLYVASAPWGAVLLDGQRIGYTALAAHPVAAGPHRLRIERLGFAPFDTTISVGQDQRLRLGTIRLRLEGGPP